MTASTAILAPPDLDAIADRANDAHRHARAAAAQAVEYATEAGRALQEAKLSIGHGGWLDWLNRNVEFSDRTARLYMRMAETVPTLSEPNRQRVADMSLREAAKAISSTHTLALMGSSASVEWYTPAHIADLAAQVLGEIDLDPCWHPDSPVRARLTYTETDDGLGRPWSGRVFLNPPYGRTIDGWIARLVENYGAGAVSEAVALVPARVDTVSWRRLDPWPRCFVAGRLRAENAENPAPFPSAIVYLGPDFAHFHRVFAPVGGIFVRVLDGGPS